jgi:hypothetical protein
VHTSLPPLRFCASLLIAATAAVGGCWMPPQTPTARQPVVSPGETVSQPPAETAAPTDQPPEEVELVSQTVEEYIQRIDAVERRIRREATSAPSDANEGELLAAGHEMPGGQSVEPREQEPSGVDQPAQVDPGPSVQLLPLPESQPAAVSKAVVEQAPLEKKPAAGAVRIHVEPQDATPWSAEAVGSVPPAQPNAPLIARDAPLTRAQIIEHLSRMRVNASFSEQVDLRVLRLLAGDYEGARQPLEMVSNEQQALAARFIESLIALREAHDGDFSTAAGKILEELEQLQAALRPLSGLRIPTIAICQEVRGYGDYTAIEPAEFPAGRASEFVLYCELRDFVSRQESDGLYYARFELRTVILTRSGDTVLELRDPDVVDRCRNRRHDCFVPRLVRLPATLAPGEYVTKVTVIDKLGQTLAEAQARFRVVAR